MNDKVHSAMELHRAVVTAALPTVVAAMRAGESDVDVLVAKRELIDTLPALGVDVTTSDGALALAGALTTCYFVVEASDVTQNSPDIVWQRYLDRNRLE